MFYQLKNTLVAAALLPLAFGCKRENPNQLFTNTTMATPETNKVQQWLKGNPNAFNGLRAASGAGKKVGTTLPNFILQWQEAKFDATAHIHWIPATFSNTKAAEGKSNTYLVATENEQGQITGGQYVMVLPNTKKMSKDQAGFEPVALMGTEKPRDFSGAILYYDVQGQLTVSQVYEAGQLQPKATANLAARDEGLGSPSPNKVITNCDGLENECIEWYWQTYVNGMLVDEEYQFTTCCNTIGGGGSGVSTAPAITSCERTQVQAQSILEGITLTNTNIITTRDGQPYGTNASEPIRKPKQIKWEFLKLRQYLEFYLYYTMVYNGVVYKNNASDATWKWESLATGNLERSGTMAPCMDVNLTYNVVDPVISSDKRSATSAISYVAIATVPCLGNPQVGNYPGSHPSATFYAN